jgi:glycosyltransferase involved in cell wall biosynthesis
LSDKKIKILTMSDHPLLPSGVGTQTKYVIQALLDSGKFKVLSLGGAVRHENYEPLKTEEYGDDWVIIPVDGYGSPDHIRSILHTEKIDMIYFMTDPRFYGWLWDMEDEIRSLVPMIYYHVWDNKPYPTYNKRHYDSTDKIVTISKITSDIVQNVAPDVDEEYVPHAVDENVFRKMSDEQISAVKSNNPSTNGKFVAAWVNRNARRKQSGTLLFWWKEFCDRVGHDKATLILHTDIRDDHGQPLDVLAEHLGLTEGQIMFSSKKVPPEHLATIYNMADVVINISDAEGFGLGTLEALACETPIIVNMTGGLQEQVTDGKEWFGVGIEPASKSVIGSPQVPWIYEDRINKDDFVDALEKLYNMTPEERHELGKKGAAHVQKNYGFKKFQERWVQLMLEAHEKYGSWDTRKNYNPWEVIDL